MPVSSDPTTHRIIRFGVFEVDLQQRGVESTGLRSLTLKATGASGAGTGGIAGQKVHALHPTGRTEQRRDPGRQFSVGLRFVLENCYAR